jgi:hypothetical protein
VAGLNNPRHDESTEGRKKFENLLKAKSTQTRGSSLSSPSPFHSTLSYVCRVVSCRVVSCRVRCSIPDAPDGGSRGHEGQDDAEQELGDGAVQQARAREGQAGQEGPGQQQRQRLDRRLGRFRVRLLRGRRTRTRMHPPPSSVCARACAVVRVSCLRVCGGACAVMCATR